MIKKDRKVIVKNADEIKPIELSLIALAIANKIRNEGINNERRSEVQ